MRQMTLEVVQLAVLILILMGCRKRNVLSRWIVQKHATRTDETDGLFEQCKKVLGLRSVPSGILGRIVLNNDPAATV